MRYILIQLLKSAGTIAPFFLSDRCINHYFTRYTVNSHACDSNVGIELAYVLKPIFHNILLIHMNKISKPFMPIFGKHMNYSQEIPNQPIQLHQ